eukprot:CAMPEP_0204488396 /NCGR_PEP_ID=MMETSP0471-20130131/69580_1 /ASSEMBLY_ACC=CAM_ASM_000602 /TAXON_ID=2969 /ORGANISM="Oxyrrhis marina" /LENGTH=37 /DNA_ID= /DNA_START= /DNA_END= /DNA_ORIENTATION=
MATPMRSTALAAGSFISLRGSLVTRYASPMVYTLYSP